MDRACRIFEDDVPLGRLRERSQIKLCDETRHAGLPRPEPRRAEVNAALGCRQRCDTATEPRPRLEELEGKAGLMEQGRESQSCKATANDGNIGRHFSCIAHVGFPSVMERPSVVTGHLGLQPVMAVLAHGSRHVSGGLSALAEAEPDVTQLVPRSIPSTSF
jgi:hypothetical protein